MLTSKDNNFIGYTFKKSDILTSLENSGMQLMAIHPLSDCLDLNFYEVRKLVQFMLKSQGGT